MGLGSLNKIPCHHSLSLSLSPRTLHPLTSVVGGSEPNICGTGILFEEPNPTGSRPSDLIGLYRKWQGKRPQPAKWSSREEGGGDRGSTAARPTLTRDWGGPQVRDPVPIVSVNPEADPPQPRAPVRPNRAEQDGETAEEKSQGAQKIRQKSTGVAAERGSAPAWREHGTHGIRECRECRSISGRSH